MINLFRIALVGVLALLLVRPAAADTIPATETMTARYCLPLNNWCAASTNYVSRRFTKTEVCAWLNGSGYGASDFSLVETGGSYGYGVCDSATPGNTDPPINITTSAIVYSCPVNYTMDGGGTTCTSNPPLCPAANTFHSSGFYNIGSSVAGSMNISPCVNGCRLFTFGSTSPPGQDLYINAEPKFRQLVDGVYHYFVEASYFHKGESCSPETANFLSEFVGSKPDNTCQAGQQMITMSGVTKCFDSEGAEVNVNSASAVAATVAAGDAAYAAMMADVSDRVYASGGSASDVVAAQTVAAGTFAAGGMSGPFDTGFAPDDPLNSFCVQNPQAEICKAQKDGAKTVGTAALEGLYVDGALINGKTVASTIGDFKGRVLASGIGSAAGGFFTVNQAAGACPVWSADVPMFGVMSFDFYCQSTFQNLLPWIRAVLLLIFSVIAFRIAIL